MTRRQSVQTATHRCECGARVPVVCETPAMSMTLSVPDDVRLTEGPPLNAGVLALVTFMQNGGEPPPITVVWINGYYRVVDGRHRWTAHMLLGLRTIQAEVLTIGPIGPPYEFAWRCGCGRAGLIAWAHANPAPQWAEPEADLFGNCGGAIA